MDKPFIKQQDIQLGLLIQDTLESYFEYEDCISPSESDRQDVEAKLKELIKVLKENNDKYTSEFEALCEELSE